MDPLGSINTNTNNNNSNNNNRPNPFSSNQQQQQQQQQHYHQQQQQQQHHYHQTPDKRYYPKSPNTSWPSSPLIKPNLVGAASANQQPIIWPARSNPTTPTITQLNREPRSPIREEPRRTLNNQQPIPQHSEHTQQQQHQQQQQKQQQHQHQPYQQQQQQQHHHQQQQYPNISQNNHQNTPSENIRPEKRQAKIRVTGIERNRRDLYIKFDAWSNLTTNRTGHCPNVSRAYKEFLSFHEALICNNPHTIVPPIPFPNTSAPSPADDDRLVASAFQQFFDRLLINNFLRNDDELRVFLESDFGYTPQTKIKKRSITSGSGWLSKPAVGSSVRTLPSSTIQQGPGGTPDTVVSIVEEDELSNAKLQFRLLEDRLVDCCRSVEQLSRSRRSLAQALLDLSGRVTQFSTTESHGALAEGFRRLGQTIRAISELETNSAVGYLVTLSDGLSWCSVSAKAAKDVLRNRAGVLHEHYTSVKKSIEKRRLIERIKSTNVSSERVESALEELEEAKKAEETIAQKAMLISTNLRPSLRSHSELLHDDLLYSLMENARTQLIYEKQILKELERVKPELDSISLRPANVIYGHSSTNLESDSHHHHHHHRHQQDYQNNNNYIRRDSSADHPNHRASLSSSTYSNHQAQHSSTIINHHHIQPTPIRTGEISKKLVVHDRLGENVDCRQRVDAKSAAASLARLF
ncbi:uncharacterized protein PGTG_04238 [Puccinia graminis f. sp. tritici CRL 75-36-700-3]|uniref:Vacuolar protein sorting-associated protein 17 n=1 Tax=Puccinia graminis f. sp. tritici (strain CRL 75-36-700-3 / race SCCL) TaxID=418459 RepID=E3K2W2_PUCGT|nr:uncharacterized protein PGTG_04238 [Puccinia graminis f. sp. tritici CRL 75-36-700-3]EFP78282.1 hypothetical protein PGTG_04238 [Puccinia graminis f. sp. tritici CRL 75-36-700-3]